MIYCSNDYYRRFKLHVHGHSTQQTLFQEERKGGLKSARAHHIYLHSHLKTHVAYLTSVERMCLFCFVGYFYFTGYGPYPGGGTLYSSLSITVPPNRLK